MPIDQDAIIQTARELNIDAHAVLLCVPDHLVAVVVVEPVFARFGRVELHLVFGNDDVELRLVNLFVLRGKAAAKPLRVQNGADVDVVFIGQRSKGFVCGEGACEPCAKKGDANSNAREGKLLSHCFTSSKPHHSLNYIK